MLPVVVGLVVVVVTCLVWWWWWHRRRFTRDLDDGAAVTAAAAAADDLLLNCETAGLRQSRSMTLPDSLDLLTPALLTWALQSDGALNYRSSVRGFQMHRLLGGVHGSVARVQLHYRHKGGKYLGSGPPLSVVVKLTQSRGRRRDLAAEQQQQQRPQQPWPSLLQSLFGPLLTATTVNAATADTSDDFTLVSYGIEQQFYRHLSKHLAGVPLPTLYFSGHNARQDRFLWLMEDLTAHSMGQPSGFSLDQCRACLRTCANIHVSFWKKEAALAAAWQTGTVWRYGGYWMGDKEMRSGQRPLADLLATTATAANADLRQALAPVLDGWARALDWPAEQQLVRTVHSLEPTTLVHGDFKLSNLFVTAANGETAVNAGAASRDGSCRGGDPGDGAACVPGLCYAIDWQWVGCGSPALDVAYFLATSVSPALLDAGDAETDLLKLYHGWLLENNTKESKFPFSTFQRHYALHTVYFALFLIRSKLPVLTSDTFQANQDRQIDGLHLRSLDHFNWLLSRALNLWKQIKSARPL